MEGGAQRSLNNQIAGVGGEWEAPGAANTFNHPFFFSLLSEETGLGVRREEVGAVAKVNQSACVKKIQPPSSLPPTTLLPLSILLLLHTE